MAEAKLPPFESSPAWFDRKVGCIHTIKCEGGKLLASRLSSSSSCFIRFFFKPQAGMRHNSPQVEFNESAKHQETSRNIKKHHVNFINFDMRKRSSGRICSFRFCRLEVGDSFTGSMSNALSSCKYGRMWHMAVTSHRKRCIKMSSWWRVLTLQNLPGCERLQLGTDASSSHPESPSSSKPLFTATTCNDWFQDVSGFNMVQYV
jgi:hypothetical protein